MNFGDREEAMLEDWAAFWVVGIQIFEFVQVNLTCRLVPLVFLVPKKVNCGINGLVVAFVQS